jgi:phosphoglucosamine mutase
MRIVVDCGHGAAYKSTPCVLRELGAEVITFGNQPDGTNINRECGSMYPEAVCQKVRELRADLGIAHDGDADRVLLCDETGCLTDGDDIMVICALDLAAQDALAKKTLVATVMSNAGLEAAMKKIGGSVIRTAVGDKNVIDEMLKGGYKPGGNRAPPHLPRPQHHGRRLPVAAPQILRIMKARQQPLSRLRRYAATRNWSPT